MPAHARPSVRLVTVLGATGSVGKNTLDLIGRNPHQFEIVALTANRDAAALASLAIRHRAQLAVVADESRYGELKEHLAGTGIEAAAGMAALIEAASRRADCVMAGISGAAGLRPTLAAVSQGRRVALANKECLVCAGEMFMDAVREAGTELVPVDLEHSAVFQAIAGADPAAIERIVLTASGGPFRTWPLERLAEATPQEALRHPNWSMGPKITHRLCNLDEQGVGADRGLSSISGRTGSARGRRASAIDRACTGGLPRRLDAGAAGKPRHAHAHCAGLAWPARMAAPTKRIDLVELGTLNFERPDERRFQALGLAREVLGKGGAAPAILNAANEVAVEAFLTGRLKFLHIAHLVAETLAQADARGLLTPPTDLNAVLAADAAARELALILLDSRAWV